MLANAIMMKGFIDYIVKEANPTIFKKIFPGLTKESKNDTAFDAVARGGVLGAGLGMAANVASRLPRALRKKLLLARLIQGGLLGAGAGAGGGLYEHSRLSKKLDQKPIIYKYYHYKNLPVPKIREQRIS